MPNSDKKVTVPNLMVVDFYADRSELSGEMKRWMDKHLNSKVLAAENCERRIWIGHQDVISTMPNIGIYRDSRVFTGAPAYAFILRYMSGIANPFGLDRPAYDRFYESTAKMVSRSPKFYSHLHEILGQLTRDSNFIISNVCDKVRPIRPWLIAREMAHQAAGSKILIIGEMDDEDPKKFTDVTKRMIATANGGDAGSPKSLTCTIAAGDEQQSETNTNLNKMIQQGKLRIPDVASAPLSDLPKIIEQADVVYVTFPLGKHAEFDAFLKNIWKNRAREDNIMLHTDIREIGDEKNFSGLLGYVPASAIKTRHEQRIINYEDQKKQAENIATDFAARRACNQSPIRDMTRFPLPQLKLI
jgi:hypothetical protein